jgi:hypothetical protein
MNHPSTGLPIGVENAIDGKPMGMYQSSASFYGEAEAGTSPVAKSDGQTVQPLPNALTMLSSDFVNNAAGMDRVRGKAVSLVERALGERIAGRWQSSDDAIFLPHTMLVNALIHLGPDVWSSLALIPAQLWAQQLSPRTKQAEEQIRQREPKARIHKGAPFFNVGLCFFVVGDFDRAFQYFSEAATEDELSGRGRRHSLLMGDNQLMEKVIVGPIVQDLIPQWQADYQNVTCRRCDEAELKQVLKWLVQRAPDAFQTTSALHRFRGLVKGLDNEASRYQMVRGLAEIVLAVESSLRLWQEVGIDAQLHQRMEALLKSNPASAAKFQAFHNDFCTLWKTKKLHETGAAMNWAVSETFVRLAALPRAADRIGIAAYFVLRLRNTLMHVNEETLDLHKNPKLCLRAAGLAFAMLRVSMHGDQNSLSAL